MTTLAFERAAYFDASIPAAPGTWLRAILNDPSRYTVETNGPSKLVFVSNGTGFTAGWKIEMLPVGSFAPTVTGGFVGSIQSVSLYDPAGALVSSITDLPANTSFGLLTGTNWLEIFGADFVGSNEADVIVGYAGGADFLDGGAGNDQLHGGTGAGSDVLIGGAGDDTLNGGAGDDYLGAGLGADFVDGGDGVDVAILDETDGPLTVWLNQAGPGGIRVDNVELVLLGDGGARVIGSFKDEAVIGGAGRDVIDGDLGNDLIAGLGGDDELHGGGGDDIFDGGPGADLIDGGAGFDIVDYSAAEGAVTVDLRITAAQQTGQGLDTVTGVEGLVSGDFGDTLSGDAQANQLESGGGDDLVDGGAGSDTLIGGQGADRVLGGDGDDQVRDEAGRNFLRGGAGNDSISGGSDFDDTHGNEGNDTVAGGLGDDWVVGGKDLDQLFGDAGDDIVYGNLGDDTCEGGDGADIVRGGQAQDVLIGGAGNDWLSGDRGDDTVTGGLGADIFHGSQDAGLDRITDFSFAEGDRVQLDPGTTYTLRQAGADTVIDMGGGHQMVLASVNLSELPAGWILGA